MSAPIPDPLDPSVAAVPNAMLTRVHDSSQCAGQSCVVHNPSSHLMRGWRLHWRGDRGLMERLCPHGIGHPDPDDVAYKARTTGDDGWGVHGCDGCCCG